MKKEQFKKMLKPIIKECIQEALVESNLISGIISEVVKGMGTQPQQPQITEQKAKYESDEDAKKRRQAREKKLNETRQTLLGAINKDAYGGVDYLKAQHQCKNQNQAVQAAHFQVSHQMMPV